MYSADTVGGTRCAGVKWTMKIDQLWFIEWFIEQSTADLMLYFMEMAETIIEFIPQTRNEGNTMGQGFLWGSNSRS